MPRLRKAHINRKVLFITTSVEEGLLFPCNPLIDLLIKSSLALAQRHHPVIVCHYIIEGTHLHMIVVVDNPDDVDGFMERFKTESAHRINKILGRRKRTVWSEGYDSPMLGTIDDAIREIAYLYTNPAKDNLVESIAEYPGLSSWKMWRDGDVEKEWTFASRSKFRALSKDSHCTGGYLRESQRIKRDKLIRMVFKISPDSWMSSFGIDTVGEQVKINERIITRIKEKEEEFKALRKRLNIRPIGKENLLKCKMDLLYRSPNRKKGRRVWCICSNIGLRKMIIRSLKELCMKAREVYEMWKKGDFSMPFPLGLYAPSVPRQANPLSSFL